MFPNEPIFPYPLEGFRFSSLPTPPSSKHSARETVVATLAKKGAAFPLLLTAVRARAVDSDEAGSSDPVQELHFSFTSIGKLIIIGLKACFLINLSSRISGQVEISCGKGWCTDDRFQIFVFHYLVNLNNDNRVCWQLWVLNKKPRFFPLVER